MQADDRHDLEFPLEERGYTHIWASTAVLDEIPSDPEARAREIVALRARIELLERGLADARAIATAHQASNLGRGLLGYVLDVICALLRPLRGSTIVVDVNDNSLRDEAKDVQLAVGPMQALLERPALERALAGEASRLMTRYESVLWLPITQDSQVAVILCLRRGANSPYSIEEQEIGELLGPLVISALQTGRRTFELHRDTEALRSLATALGPSIRSGGGRVAAKARDADLLAHHLNVRRSERQTIQLAAMLCDIGTVDLAEDVLHGTSLPSWVDFDQVRQHPLFGAEIVRQLPRMDDIIPLIRHHHERWDGSGYPDGLVGNETPLGARIIAVLDAFHAHPGSPRQTRSTSNALQALLDGAGSRFDPAVVEAFAKLTRERENSPC